MSLSLIVLLLVFVGIALRQVLRIPVKIWQMMSIGALIAFLTRSITLKEAYDSISWEVMAFLFGMFYLGQALEESGYLSDLASRSAIKQMSKVKLIAFIVFGMGLLSALLMNDTLAIIGTPVLVKIADKKKIPLTPLLLGLAYAVTIGSVLSPIGNPQNFLIAMEGTIQNPFHTFLSYLGIPTLLSLFLLFGLILWLTKQKESSIEVIEQTEPYNIRLILFCKIAFTLVIAMVGINIFFSLFRLSISVPLYCIGLIPGLFLLIAAPKKKEVLKKMDWHTLIFFVALFILMKSVWETSELKQFPARFTWMTSSELGILSMSILGSQLISNVPLVALYLPSVSGATSSIQSLMALAAGSTLAGNFLIFGAASNFIIMQSAEKRGKVGIPFFRFALYGIPLTVVSVVIFWLCL